MLGSSRPARVVAVTLLLGLAASVVVTTATAQSFLFPGDQEATLSQGEFEVFDFRVRHALNTTLIGFARIDGGLAEWSEVAPQEFRVQPGGTRDIAVNITTEGLDLGTHNGRLRITLVDQHTGRTQSLSANVTMAVRAPALVFDIWQNPLPEPLDGPVGVFLIEAFAWLLAAWVGVKVNDLIVSTLMGRVPGWLKDRVLKKVDTPIFILIVAAGARTAWRVFPNDGLYAVVDALLGAAVVLLVAFVAYRFIDALLVYYSEHWADRTESKLDDVAVPVLRKVAAVVIVAFGFVYIFQIFGVDLGFLVAGGLIIGLIASTALGPGLSNLFSGLFIMVDRPFYEGDDIRLDTGEVCRVEKIGMRSTRLYFYRNHEYIVMPNNDLASKPVVNLLYPDSRYRMHIEVGVAYGSDINQVRDLLMQIADENETVLDDEDSMPTVLFDGFGDSALLFRLIVYLDNVRDRFQISSDLRFRIDEVFREHEITIPFPQRTLWFNEVTKQAAGDE